MTVYIQLTLAGGDTGPFNLFSDIDGYSSAFETDVSRYDLSVGYASTLVPDGTNIIRVMSTGLCTNFIDIPVQANTTTTTTTIACYCTEVFYVGVSSADFSYVDCYGVGQVVSISTPSEKYCGSGFTTDSPDISFVASIDSCIFDGDYICSTTTTTTTIALTTTTTTTLLL